jgi:hypothetical protein
MVKALLLAWLIMAVAIAIAAAVVPSVEIDGGCSRSWASPCSSGS